MRLIISMAVEVVVFSNKGIWECFLSEHASAWWNNHIKPPNGDPDADPNKYWLLKRTLYGLKCSPCHWYSKIKCVLNQLGLHQNAYDPCLFTGHIHDPMFQTRLPLLLWFLVYMLITSSTSWRILQWKPSRTLAAIFHHSRFYGYSWMVSWYPLDDHP